MDARFQQFLYANTNHNFPLVKIAGNLPNDIPRNTGLVSMLLWPPALTRAQDLRPFPPPVYPEKGLSKVAERRLKATAIFKSKSGKERGCVRAWGHQPQQRDQSASSNFLPTLEQFVPPTLDPSWFFPSIPAGYL